MDKHIKFLDDVHQERFDYCIKKCNIHDSDFYRKSLFYILTSNQELSSKFPILYDFKRNMLNSDNFEKILTNKLPQSHKCLIKLAIKLFNDCHFKEYDFFSNFDYLDEDNRFVLLQSMNIRYM